MPNTPHHSNKEISKAITYAINKGWRIEKAGPRAHVWGRAFCPERSEMDTFSIFTLLQGIQHYMRASCYTA